ncbi:hypothetical protein COOONC_01519, partial [Cooperia oncophora]
LRTVFQDSTASEGSSDDSVETALSISSIPEHIRVKYSFLNGKKIEVSHGAFTDHADDDTLAMKDLDLYGASQKKATGEMDMKQLRDYFAVKKPENPPTSAKKSTSSTGSSLPRKKKKKHKKKKSALLKGMIRDMKKKTGVKTPPPAQKAALE